MVWRFATLSSGGVSIGYSLPRIAAAPSRRSLPLRESSRNFASPAPHSHRAVTPMAPSDSVRGRLAGWQTAPPPAQHDPGDRPPPNRPHDSPLSRRAYVEAPTGGRPLRLVANTAQGSPESLPSDAPSGFPSLVQQVDGMRKPRLAVGGVPPANPPIPHTHAAPSPTCSYPLSSLAHRGRSAGVSPAGSIRPESQRAGNAVQGAVGSGSGMGVGVG